MYAPLINLIDQLEEGEDSGVLNWGCPIPSFGDVTRAYVATLGINPSDKEFTDDHGVELKASLRRFHTLDSLGISNWAEIEASHLRLIVRSCEDYFDRNPYDRWFKVLDRVLSGADVSYYGSSRSACHLDLVPYATEEKWGSVPSRQRAALLDIGGETLGVLLRDSPIQYLILNGSSVVEQFEFISEIEYEIQEIQEWSLPRRTGKDVQGIAYSGNIVSLAGIEFERTITVLGFNHNLQSSFGVTSKVISGIRNWLTSSIRIEFD